MIELQIKHTKEFMAKLLGGTLFEDFLLEEATIETFNTFNIDGHIHKEFYGQQLKDDPSLCPYPLSCWQDVQQIAFNLIKGKHTPLSFKFILHLKPDKAAAIFNESEQGQEPVADYVIRISFSDGSIKITTGISFKVFSLDNSGALLWDDQVKKFLDAQNIEFEEL
ncbi:MAG: DUF5721 family protein [Butyrivibrio sp.]|nr:DUF5721 family protein [Butyrivibrio sp.]